MKLLITAPHEGAPPLYAFLDGLEEKQRQKLFSLFALLLQAPKAAMREPYVKHFKIERYQALYELRAKSKTVIRVIFTLTGDGNVLFLSPSSSATGGTPSRRWTHPCGCWRNAAMVHALSRSCP